MARTSAFSALTFYLVLCCASSARAGDIYFSADAQINASRDQIQGSLDIKLRATEWVYNPAVFARGEGLRQELARFETWTPDETKHIEFSIPSPHRWPGEYDLLVEIHFQDVGGASLSANLSVRYQLNEQSLLSASPKLTLDNLRLQWDPDLQADAAISLYAPPPRYFSATRITHTPRDQKLAWTVDPQLPLRPNSSYPQVARLDYVSNGVHGSQLVAWNLISDERGQLLAEPTAEQKAAAKTLTLHISSEATLTASATMLEGTASLEFADYGPIRDVEISTLDAQGQSVIMGTRSDWQPNTPFAVNFRYPMDHNLPGGYIMILTIAFDDAEGFAQSTHLGFEYSVNRAIRSFEPPNVVLEGTQLQWHAGDVDPALIALQVTTSPAWTPLIEPLSPAQHQLNLTRSDPRRTASSWNYPQLARLSWVVDGFHFSTVLPWTMRTNSQGDWAGGPGADPSAPAQDTTAWWRREKLLWFGVVLLLGVGLIFGVLRPKKETRDE